MKPLIKIFAIIFIPIAFIILANHYISSEIIKDNSYKQLKTVMSSNWDLISNIDLNNIKSIKQYEKLKSIADKSNMRFTVINNQGVVLLDTDITYDNISKMANHINRDEIRNAMFNIPNFSTRTSETTGNETIYYAKMLNDNATLRIAYDTQYLNSTNNYTQYQALILLNVILILVAIATIITAIRLSDPIRKLNKMSEILLHNKNESIPEFTDTTMNKISDAILVTHKNLAKHKTLLDIEKEKINTVFEVMNEAILLIDSSGKLIYFNSKAEKYLGINLKEGINIKSDIININIINFISHALKHNDNKPFLIKLNDKMFSSYVKKINEQSLIVFYDNTDQNNYDDYKNNLVENITHELKTPLSLIIGASETIINETNMDSDIRNKFLRQINSNANRLNNIINDTIELCRLDSEEDMQSIDESTIIENLIEDIYNYLPKDSKKNIDYNISVDDGYVNIRHFDLLSILINLISNASRYSTGDNILVDIIKEQNKITLRVQDDGPLIPVTEREKIFERFYTVHKSRSRDLSGSGLGLSIVKHITNIYSGVINLKESEKGGGNCFEIILIEKRVINEK